MRRRDRRILVACLVVAALGWRPDRADAQASITGFVSLPHEVVPTARRPDVRGLGMPRPRAATTRARSVVYVEVAPQEAFETARPTGATIDQRDETFVPHLVAITTGGEVRSPTATRRITTCSRCPRSGRSTSGDTLRARASPSASTAPASCVSSATFTRT